MAALAHNKTFRNAAWGREHASFSTSVLPLPVRCEYRLRGDHFVFPGWHWHAAESVGNWHEPEYDESQGMGFWADCRGDHLGATALAVLV